MKKIILLICLIALVWSCSTANKTINEPKEESTGIVQDTVRIANEELEYEVIIIDPAFNIWLQTRARPRGFYDQNFLESRNIVWANEWNYRVLNPQRYRRFLYEFQINYDPNIDYGYEVNYLIYNYFLYFQLRYKQRLSYFVPRI
jgi:hypothetical protein